MKKAPGVIKIKEDYETNYDYRMEMYCIQMLVKSVNNLWKMVFLLIIVHTTLNMIFRVIWYVLSLW